MTLPWWPNCGGIKVAAILSQPGRFPQAKAYLGYPRMESASKGELHGILLAKLV